MRKLGIDYFDNVKFKVPLMIKMWKRINTLENENETLKNAIKDKLYIAFMDKLGEPMKTKRLEESNKNLRAKVKELKQLLKEDN